jgi:hypothetical protein
VLFGRDSRDDPIGIGGLCAHIAPKSPIAAVSPLAAAKFAAVCVISGREAGRRSGGRIRLTQRRSRNRPRPRSGPFRCGDGHGSSRRGGSGPRALPTGLHERAHCR